MASNGSFGKQQQPRGLEVPRILSPIVSHKKKKEGESYGSKIFNATIQL